jgi:hypothetical protein
VQLLTVELRQAAAQVGECLRAIAQSKHRA